MTTSELKEHLLTAHQRDKKLSILGISLILIAILVIGSLLYIFAYDVVVEIIGQMAGGFIEMATKEDAPFYYKLIIPGVILSIVANPIHKVIQLSKRPKRIDELITKIEGGLIAMSIDESIVYKIVIPLIKIKLNLAPVKYVSIVLDGDTNFKPFLLPIDDQYVPDLRKILSGVNLQDIDKAWYELYGESTTSNTDQDKGLKPKEEFKKFVETDLINDLTELDGERSKGKKKYIIYMIFSVIAIGAFYGGNFYLQTTGYEYKVEYMVYGVMAFSILISGFFYMRGKFGKNPAVYMDSGNKFKMKILKPMIEFVNPNFQYILHGHITLPELLETGVLQNKHYTLDGNDQIVGSHKGVPFQLSDLDVQYKRTLSSEKSGPDTVFYGQVFIAKFNKSFNSEVYLVPKKTTTKKIKNAVVPDIVGAGLAGSRSTDIDMYTSNTFGSKVILEDPEFSKMFNVYCEDQTEARYILTPALMERLKTLNTRTNGDLFISFKNDRVSVLNNNGKNNFEAGMFKSMTKDDNKMLMDFYTDLCDQLLIIDDLKLNINIWNKN